MSAVSLRSRAVSCVVLALVGMLTVGCSDTDSSDSASAKPEPTSAQHLDVYSTKTFTWPFDVNPPTWSVGPLDEEATFATWISADDQHAVRFLAPVNVYETGSGSTAAVALPNDYTSYVLSQSEQQVEFTDVTEITVDSRPATVMNAQAGRGLDGSIGCPEEDMAAGDCYGFQPEHPVRIAVVKMSDSTPLVIWSRQNSTDSAEDRAADGKAFDAMLASLHFR